MVISLPTHCDPGREPLPYISYIGMCGPKALVFSHFSHKKGIELAILILNRVWVLYSTLELNYIQDLNNQ